MNKSFYGAAFLDSNGGASIEYFFSTPYGDYYLFRFALDRLIIEGESPKKITDEYTSNYEKNRKTYSIGITAIINFLENKIDIDNFWKTATKEKDSKKILKPICKNLNASLLDNLAHKPYTNVISELANFVSELTEQCYKYKIEVVPDTYYSQANMIFFNLGVNMFVNKTLHANCAMAFLSLPISDRPKDSLKNVIADIIKNKVKSQVKLDLNSKYIRGLNWPIDNDNLPFELISYEKFNEFENFTFKNRKNGKIKKLEFVNEEINKRNAEIIKKNVVFEKKIAALKSYVEENKNFNKAVHLLKKK